MFNLVTKHKRVAQLILFLLMVPFAFFGVDFYFRGGGLEGLLATVGGEKITENDFNDAIREQSDTLRRQMGANFDPKMFDNAQVRFALLDNLVNQKLVSNKARDEKFRVSDAQLQQYIGSIPTFQVDGRFNNDRYRMFLAAQNMPAPYFEQRLRQDLMTGAVQDAITQANIVAHSSAERFIGLLEQQREVALATVDIDPFLKDVKVDDAQVREFYDKNPAAFQVPEQAKIEYLLLTPDALSAQVTVTPEEVRKQYDASAAQYTAPEERSASHILIPVAADAKEDAIAAAKKLADEIYAKAKANPAKFADLAREFSKDPGSAAQGGDLGSFGRGSMVKPFEDAVFAAKTGDLLPPVRTEFGWHVIKVTGERGAHTRPFEEVRAQIEAELKKQKAAQKFATAADQFQNLVYEQADSLAGAAKALDLKVETTPGFVTRAQAQAIGLGSAKFVDALFSPDSIQGKRNTEAIEVGTNALISARILEYKAAAPRPFDEVKNEIRQQLVRKAASELAQKTGQAKLAELNAGKTDSGVGLAFGKPITVGRGQFQPGLPPDVLNRVFMVDPQKLPAYTGATNERGGFSIVRVLKVDTPAVADKARVDAASERLSSEVGRELFNAYLASLRAKTEVKINQAQLDKR
ncbi:MAG: SurA N-terminal domain-containing protein [Burkholderiales bacterium]|nr:SurA N-terminal domain-containing protein [Burkholderiales bacterium]